MEPSLAGRWMAAGHLPHLAGLRDSGCFVPLASVRPPVTYPAWTTCVTGVNPGKHGIFDFTEVVEGAHAIRFVNSTYRQAPALWNVLSEAGKRVCVLGVPGAYPPEPVNGLMVSGFDSPVASGVDRSFVCPPSRYLEVAGWRFGAQQESHIGPGWHDRALPLLLDKIAVKERIAADLLAQEPWDFFMAVFGESDTVSHHFWMFHDPRSPRHRPGHETAIRQVYARLDAAVGRLMAAAGEDVVVGVVSDHGFGGAGTGVVHLNNWLAEQGHLAFSAQGGGVLKEIALRTVPQAWRGPLFRKFQGMATRAESKSRFGGIDWKRTRAWSEELNYFPSVRVNLKGRDPEGQVSRQDYDAFVGDLCAELEAWTPVARATPRAECFDGPALHKAPDIVLELALEDGYSHSCLRSRGGPAFRRIRPEEYLGGKERGMNGNHRATGVLFLSETMAADGAALADIAPTVLAVLGVPAPPMDGRALLGEAARGEAGFAPGAVKPLAPDEEAVIEDRLRALGYYE